MEITVFAEACDSERGVYGPTWYISTKKYNLLLVAGSSAEFWEHAGECGIRTEDLDLVMLLQGCQDPIRELEYVLTHNERAVVFLPRRIYEGVYRSLYQKVRSYRHPLVSEGWGERIVFMDEDMRIGEEIRVFPRGGIRRQGRPARQNLMLREGDVHVLFVNEEQDVAEHMRQKAEAISGDKIGYLFYRGPSRQCLGRDCRNCSQRVLSQRSALKIG